LRLNRAARPAGTVFATTRHGTISGIGFAGAIFRTHFMMYGHNPVYDAPADVDFAELLARKGLVSVHLSSHRNETSLESSWHIAQAHELEAWGDQQALDGTVALQQPLIAPLYGGLSTIEVLARLAAYTGQLL